MKCSNSLLNMVFLVPLFGSEKKNKWYLSPLYPPFSTLGALYPAEGAADVENRLFCCFQTACACMSRLLSYVSSPDDLHFWHSYVVNNDLSLSLCRTPIRFLLHGLLRCSYGPPPSYPNLKIPGLNAAIPEVSVWQMHPNTTSSMKEKRSGFWRPQVQSWSWNISWLAHLTPPLKWII